MAAYELKNIAVLNVKGVDFRCVLWGISKISHAYPAMMKLGTVIPYPKKIQKIYESRDTHSEFY